MRLDFAFIFTHDKQAGRINKKIGAPAYSWAQAGQFSSRAQTHRDRRHRFISNSSVGLSFVNQHTFFLISAAFALSLTSAADPAPPLSPSAERSPQHPSPPPGRPASDPAPPLVDFELPAGPGRQF